MEPYMELVAVDIEVSQDDIEVESAGTAYYRLPDDLFSFLTVCQERHGILGFEWDGTRNFGVILVKPADEKKV